MTIERDQVSDRRHPTIALGACEVLGVVTPIAAWIWRMLFLVGLCYWGVGFGIYIIVSFCLPTPDELLRKT